MKVLLLGSGALKIGEAGEFDYSGSQALKALKEEGVQTVLVNPNIATIQTGREFADRIYFLPVNREFVERIIKREKPDGILLGFGGQTALNCGVSLEGALERHKVRVLGTPLRTINETEDRALFVAKLGEIGVLTPRGVVVTSVRRGMAAASSLGFPLMVRVSYDLGGRGSGVVRDAAELQAKLERAFAFSKRVLLEEYLHGWKEIEYEVVRDGRDNCLTVCNMENLDPMGFHTGESAVVAPSQTLTNFEYHELRRIAIQVVRHLGVVGECNIQFALDPARWDYRVIEVNARLSRSSALASKATAYPLAYVAAKLALGKTLPELRNSVTGVTTTCFEPALDYIVCKIPRWDLQKFRRVESKIGSEMKSVGEVMGIGRNFEEAFQKALRMLEIGVDGFDSDLRLGPLAEELKTDKRFFAIAKALRLGWPVPKLRRITGIDPWFLERMKGLVAMDEKLRAKRLTRPVLLEAKRAGFSDARIAVLAGRKEASVRALRKRWGIVPAVKQMDTLAAEYPARTNYLYLTYDETEDDIAFGDRGVLVLGSGPYRIGSSVEFDWCSVSCVRSLAAQGRKTIVLNSNPETVSTDYDISDRLYFEEMTLERVLDVCDKERPDGVVVSMGGQTPNNLAAPLARNGVRILGTAPSDIVRAEDRNKFSALLDRHGVEQPEWKELSSLRSARAFARTIGFPVLIRPSFVLSGSSMSVAFDLDGLERYLAKAGGFSPGQSIIITKFIEGAKEIEFDGVAAQGELLCYAIGEHIENAGVHSGDATIILPAQRIHVQAHREVRLIAKKIARALRISGPFNIQFIAKDDRIKVIECNLRASRTFPFVSKTYGVDFIDIATRAMLGESTGPVHKSLFETDAIAIKAPQFSFSRLKKADPILSVEMASTGEVACFGRSVQEAFLKAIVATGFRIPRRSVFVSIKGDVNRVRSLDWIRGLAALGFEMTATEHTAEFLRRNGIAAERLYKLHESREPNVRTRLKGGRIDLVINIPFSYDRLEFDDSYELRRMAVDFGIPLITNIQLARLLAESLAAKPDLEARPWDEYLG